MISINFSALSQLHSSSKKAISHYNSALSNYRLMDYEGAKKEVDAAIQGDSDFIEAYLLKSEIYTDLKDYNKLISRSLGPGDKLRTWRVCVL